LAAPLQHKNNFNNQFIDKNNQFSGLHLVIWRSRLTAIFTSKITGHSVIILKNEIT